MGLKHATCRSCFLRDKAGVTPFFMSADNDMDPGDLLNSLPELTRVEKMAIARSHVQMMVCRYRGPPVPLLKTSYKFHAEYCQDR